MPIAFLSHVEDTDLGAVECGVGLKLPLGLEREAPTAHSVTQYDRLHFQHYARLLDAVAEGVTNDEMCMAVLGLDPNEDRAEAHKVLQSHIRRARWMMRTGFRQLQPRSCK